MIILWPDVALSRRSGYRKMLPAMNPDRADKKMVRAAIVGMNTMRPLSRDRIIFSAGAAARAAPFYPMPHERALDASSCQMRQCSEVRLSGSLRMAIFSLSFRAAGP